MTDPGTVFVDPSAYADEARFHAACAALRRDSPVHRVEAEGFRPFWALTRHEHVMAVESQGDRWLAEPRFLLMTAAEEERALQQAALVRMLVSVDGDEHRQLRGVTADWFKPRSLRRLEGRIAHLARLHVDRLVGRDDPVDLARELCMQLPLQVILAILGLPETDYPRMLTLTQELFGGHDDELRRGATPEEQAAVVLDFFTYFEALTADRRATPTDDLASTIANATIDGEPLSPGQTIGYYLITATAGHDTTSSALAGGLHALVEHPDQRQRLAADPGLLPTAVDEVVRWVTPVKQFMRTAVADERVGDVTVAAGEAVLLSYPSANRDEAVFDDPFRFDVGRSPNRHLAFGFGAHHCLGAMLAKMEMRALYAELLPRLAAVEPAGPAELSHTLFVGGLKHLPVHLEVRPAAA